MKITYRENYVIIYIDIDNHVGRNYVAQYEVNEEQFVTRRCEANSRIPKWISNQNRHQVNHRVCSYIASCL